MRCARSWKLEQRWRQAVVQQGAGISAETAAAYDEYRYHLATCVVCQDRIHYFHGLMDMAVTEEQMGEKLAGILKTLVSRSGESGQPQRYALANGLRIDVRITPQRCSLLLSRENQFPSEIEWSVITRHWHPTPLMVDYERVEQGGRHYLRASWTPEGLPVQLEIAPGLEAQP